MIPGKIIWVQIFPRLNQYALTINDQTSKLSQIKAYVPQGSFLGHLLFIVYINDLPEGLTKNAKRFAYDTLIFSVVRDSSSSSLSLNEDLSKLSHWTYQRKMLLNPAVSKQAL